MIFPYKGFYQRGADAYRPLSAIEYARSLGCTDLMLHARLYHPSQAALVRAAGMRPWVWSGPDSWAPGQWPRTWDTCRATAERDGLTGVVADIETADAWSQHRGELELLIATLDQWSLAQASSGRSVGVTTVPAHPVRSALRSVPHVWVSPQLYGVRVSTTTGRRLSVAELLAWADTWLSDFGDRTIPSLHISRRSPAELATYLSAMSQRFRGAILWSDKPAPTLDTAQARLVMRFDPGRPFVAPAPAPEPEPERPLPCSDSGFYSADGDDDQ